MPIIQTFFGSDGNSDPTFEPIFEWQSFIHGRRFLAERAKRFGDCRFNGRYSESPGGFRYDDSLSK